MATTKPKARPAAKRKKTAETLSDTTVVIETKIVPITMLKPFHKNPRVGNIELIAESLKENKQFRPILVNIGTLTGRPNEILAGNHTYLGARRLGWETILASFIDVDEQEARKIVLADNRTAEDGTYDEAILAELLNSLDKAYDGTGYSADEAQDFIANATKAATKMAAESMASIDLDALKNQMPVAIDERPKDPRQQRIDEEDEDTREANNARGAGRTNFDDDKDIEDVEQDEGSESQAETLAKLQAILEAREENYFMGDNFFQIPDLREDMLLMEWPKDVQTWAGWEATPDDGQKTFLYNYGLGGVKGLPLDRTILAFNTHDDKFNNWWAEPGYYTAKMLSGGLRMAICPDFSFYYTTPRVRHLDGVFRSQWLGRFFQEAGIRVVPRLQFDDEKSLQFNMLGIPKNPPLLTASVQNTRDDMGSKDDSEKRQAVIIQKMVDALEPTRAFIIYGGNPGRRVLERLDLHGAEPIWVENYAAVRRGTVFDKKDGLQAVSGKKRREIRESALAEEAERQGVTVETLKSTGRRRKPVKVVDEDED